MDILNPGGSWFLGEARHKLGEVFAEAYRLVTPAERFDEAVMAFTRDRVLLAPVWISIGMEPDAVKKMPEWEEISAVAMAVHNMHLMACSLGLGCKWSSGTTKPTSPRGTVPGVTAASAIARLPLRGPSSRLGLLASGRLIAEKVKWVVE